MSICSNLGEGNETLSWALIYEEGNIQEVPLALQTREADVVSISN